MIQVDPALTAAVDASRDFFGRVLMLHRAEKRGDRLVCACGRISWHYRGNTPLSFAEWHPRHVRAELSLELAWRRPDFTAGVPPLEVNLLHARDIPDAEFLDAVWTQYKPWCPAALLRDVRVELRRRGFQAPLARSGQGQDQVPLKLVAAKMRRLIDRGLIERRTWSGSRSLFQLTDAGGELLARNAERGR
ncbi:hypothetical protein AB0E01_22530 [Nocardia vinacea]|uniref:hypothetical protein n=1 Tax=Nocardia vinacea TaxID=96468 RepID=UPI0033DBF984